ncbi:MAG: ABC transporter ATP-binding protein [Candidatus Hadarchaeum sp.]|uniref:ABC transporter ATP-binding protein n=1 Tax=Candidatus Hadarchaeum sp. TaxID=2883567 RepID=UPI003178F7F4
MLEVTNIRSGYGGSEVLHGINLKAERGKFTLVIGPNGAGKTTLLRTIMNILKPYEGEIIFEGKSLKKLSPSNIIKSGIFYVPQGAMVFPDMTVRENLEIAGRYLKNKAEFKQNIQKVHEIFPILKDREKQKAGFLSGGERQMLNIARAVVSGAKLILLDEPSLGLDIGKRSLIAEELKQLKKKGYSFLAVEQVLGDIAKLSDRVYVLSAGEIKYRGDNSILNRPDKLASLFFG